MEDIDNELTLYEDPYHTIEMYSNGNANEYNVTENWYDTFGGAPSDEKILKTNLTFEQAINFIKDIQRKEPNKWITENEFLKRYNEYENMKVESSNKYVKAFREAVEKLEEENAATKYYKDVPWHYQDDDFSNQATSFVSKMGTLFDYIRKLHDDYGFEIKNEIPNSQSKRLYNTLDKMYNLIPGIKKDMGYDASENEYGNKEFSPYF